MIVAGAMGLQSEQIMQHLSFLSCTVTPTTDSILEDSRAEGMPVIREGTNSH